ncbi:SsrA-binding protein SmpB [Stratiformator vulcanicus]|uniref:SsrA-binding protein n=1 Tax=Stratiformator vulcanicus TaxID=2527980 RepID=A0A517QZQ7_9PLAN|nr:SsrA-binding protein SmpB [Stratiformator vulcanicus]QDT37098.1 SsrA-binding protein [Stratiformator vulcanicus]
MAKSKGKSGRKNEDPNERVVVRNRKARHDYELLDTLECGIVLTGSEVKSIRNGKVVIEDGYARMQRDELWLINADIAEYPQATIMNHERRRERKLLVRKSQLRKFAESAQDRGLTIVPLSLYFKRGIVKVEVATAKGRKTHDKRQKLKAKTDVREMRAEKLRHS